MSSHANDYARFKRTGKRNEIFLATKFGFVLDRDVIKDGPAINGTPEYVHKALERSLKRLGVGNIDLWYCHRCAIYPYFRVFGQLQCRFRPDATVPIEVRHSLPVCSTTLIAHSSQYKPWQRP